jgi:hypothetical protein
MPRRTRWLLPLAMLAVLHAVILSTPVIAFAQQRPSQDLIARAKSLFDDQQYEESIQTLSAALVRPINTKAQKIEIYRLLALNYITLNRKDEAESAVRGLLALEPDYALPASESPRFRDFFTAVKQKWEAEGRPGLVKESEAPPAAVTMQHNSPSQAEANNQVDLTAHLTDPQHRVVSVKLFYRTGSKGKFDDVDASVDKTDVRATIPKDAVKPPIVEYYLSGFDKGGLPIVSRGDAGAPLRIAVPEASKGWIVPVAIGGGILAAGAIVGGLFLAGVFKSGGGGTPPPPPSNTASVTVNVQ